MRQCFELIDAKHSKFWTVETIGPHYLATFGRIGTAGQTQVKSLGTARQAEEKAEEMIAEKIRKGYRRVGDNDHNGASASLRRSLTGNPSATIPDETPETPRVIGARHIVPIGN